MADDLTNALAQSAHSSTVLQGIMNPAQVNPLAGYSSAINAVSGMQGLAESNAKRAAGQAFLDSIDPATGQPNQSLLLKNLQKDPSTAYAAQSSAASGQALDTATYNLHMTRLGNVANEMGQLIADYPHGVPQEAANAAIDRAVQAGHFTPADAAIARSHLSPDPVNNSQVITQGLFRNLTAQQALSAAKPATGTLDTGQSTTGTATTPQGSTTGQPGAITPAGQPIVSGLPSRTTLGAPTKWQDNQGIEHNTTWEEYVAARNRGLTTKDPLLVGGQPYQPGAPGAAAPPPPPRPYVVRPAPAPAPSGGTPSGAGTYQGPGMGVLPAAPGQRSDLGGGMQVASANGSAPSVGSAAPPSPAVPGDVNAILAGINQARAASQGGTQEAFNALQSGGVPGTAQAPSQASQPPAATSPSTTPKMTDTLGPRPGLVGSKEETGKQSATMGGALISRGDQAPVQKANLQNMMTDLSKLDSMGPGTDKEIFLNSVMQKLTGYGFSMNRDQVAAGNSFAKLANIAVGQQLAAIGGTDARQNLFMGSNPHLDMSKLGNERIIQMLMGNEDAIQAKARAWTAWSQSHGDDTYRQFQDDFNRHFDPRVFQSQYMAKGGPELAALRASLEREGTGAIEKFKADTKYARDNRWIQ